MVGAMAYPGRDWGGYSLAKISETLETDFTVIMVIFCDAI